MAIKAEGEDNALQAVSLEKSQSVVEAPLKSFTDAIDELKPNAELGDNSEKSPSNEVKVIRGRPPTSNRKGSDDGSF